MLTNSFMSELNDEEGFKNMIGDRHQITWNKFNNIVSKDIILNLPIVIYFAAGHMPIFEQELKSKLTMELESEEWIEAYSFKK